MKETNECDDLVSMLNERITIKLRDDSVKMHDLFWMLNRFVWIYLLMTYSSWVLTRRICSISNTIEQNQG